MTTAEQVYSIGCAMSRGNLGRVQSNIGVKVGRQKACPYRGHGGRRRGANVAWCLGGVAGESPRTREGRRPDRPNAVISRQWSEGTALAMLGDVTWLELIFGRGVRDFTPNLDCTLEI